MVVWFIPKQIGAFIVNLNVNFNILNQFNCALVGQIKDFYNIKMHGATVKIIQSNFVLQNVFWNLCVVRCNIK
jgi:hypothetical protein